MTFKLQLETKWFFHETSYSTWYYLYNYINKNPYEIIVDDFIAEYILVIKGLQYIY